MNQIEKIRKEKKMSRLELERKSGISYPTLWRIEKKGLQVKRHTLVRIAEALEVPIEKLFNFIK
jgi:transcriptional regulator with XRE-family HTH domain